MRHTFTAFATAAALLACPLAAHSEPETGSFVGSGSTQFFGFEIDYVGLLTGSVVSSFTGLSGYDITSVTLDGVSLLDSLPDSGDDAYSFSVTVAPGEHILAVKGKAYGGLYVGSYAVTPVPEATAGVLSLGGLAVLAWVAQRRRRA
jgi:hypothetical protein